MKTKTEEFRQSDYRIECRLDYGDNQWGNWFASAANEQEFFSLNCMEKKARQLSIPGQEYRVAAIQ